MTTTRIVASLDAFNPAGEKITICIQEAHSDYIVFIDGGLLGDGEDEALYSTLGQALQRMSDEAAIAILGHDGL